MVLQKQSQHSGGKWYAQIQSCIYIKGEMISLSSRRLLSLCFVLCSRVKRRPRDVHIPHNRLRHVGLMKTEEQIVVCLCLFCRDWFLPPDNEVSGRGSPCETEGSGLAVEGETASMERRQPARFNLSLSSLLCFICVFCFFNLLIWFPPSPSLSLSHSAQLLNK